MVCFDTPMEVFIVNDLGAGCFFSLYRVQQPRTGALNLRCRMLLADRLC